MRSADLLIAAFTIACDAVVPVRPDATVDVASTCDRGHSTCVATCAAECEDDCCLNVCEWECRRLLGECQDAGGQRQ